MRYVFAFLFVMTSFGVSAQQPDCADAGNLPQQAMNQCAYLDYQRADRALNTIWPKVKEWAKETDKSNHQYAPQHAVAYDNLLKAQRAWINYRDGHCETEGMQAAGGSLQPLIVSSCKAAMTRKRTEELILLLEEF